MTNLAELDMYLERLCDALGHADRRTSLKHYCQGLMLPIVRKSVEPLAAHIEPTQARQTSIASSFRGEIGMIVSLQVVYDCGSWEAGLPLS